MHTWTNDEWNAGAKSVDTAPLPAPKKHGSGINSYGTLN